MIDDSLVGQLTTPTTSSLLSRNHRLALGSIVRYFSGSCEDVALALVGTWVNCQIFFQVVLNILQEH